ncbi:LPXTG cell wall anchor domain-containing protein, partial [Enterococcus faecalis]
EFPRTGETKNHTIITSGVIIVLSILGLLGYRKKQKDD